MGRRDLFRNGLVKVSVLFHLALTSCTYFPSGAVREITFVEDGLFLASFEQTSRRIRAGDSITIWVTLENRSEDPRDIAELPVSIDVYWYDEKEGEWELPEESSPEDLEIVGMYMPGGVVGFFPFECVRLMKTEILKEPHQRTPRFSCVAPAYLLDPGMNVKFSQRVTFCRKGRWRVWYSFANQKFCQEIVVV